MIATHLFTPFQLHHPMDSEFIINDSSILSKEQINIEPECQSLQPEPLTKPQGKVLKKKARKGQSEEEYLEQKTQFYQEGPRINTENWLYDENILKNLDSNKKPDRAQMILACEKAYFQRDYEKCLELVQLAESIFEVEPQDVACDKPETKAAKKKIKHHVVELMHIKESCLKKLQS